MLGKCVCKNKILIKISEESIFTLFCLEMNLRFGSSQIMGANNLCEFAGCVPLWYWVCFSVLFSSGSQISLTVNSWAFWDIIQIGVVIEESKTQIH